MKRRARPLEATFGPPVPSCPMPRARRFHDRRARVNCDGDLPDQAPRGPRGCVPRERLRFRPRDGSVAVPLWVRVRYGYVAIEQNVPSRRESKRAQPGASSPTDRHEALEWLWWPNTRSTVTRPSNSGGAVRRLAEVRRLLLRSVVRRLARRGHRRRATCGAGPRCNRPRVGGPSGANAARQAR